MYQWLVWLHIVAALAFMAAHGTSIAVAFRMKRVTTPEEARPILDLSRSTLGFMYVTFFAVALTGLAAGIWLSWWKTGWWWASVVILLGVGGSMLPLAVRPFHRARYAVGLPYMGSPPGADRKPQPAEPETRPDELRAAVAALKPQLLATIGLVGVAVLVWLMRFKPF